MRGPDPLGALYRVGADGEPALLDELVERAGQGWRCRAGRSGHPCNHMNVGTARCERCGAGEAPGREDPDG